VKTCLSRGRDLSRGVPTALLPGLGTRLSNQCIVQKGLDACLLVCRVLHRSVLLLEDRTPIGCVEEVFGPVTMPLYALRYGGPQPQPAGLATSARVFFTGD
jgi:hypothetical protein